MAKPIVNKITPFDAEMDKEIGFTWNGSQSYANRLIIYNADSMEKIYDKQSLRLPIPTQFLPEHLKTGSNGSHNLRRSMWIIWRAACLTNDTFRLLRPPSSISTVWKTDRRSILHLIRHKYIICRKIMKIFSPSAFPFMTERKHCSKKATLYITATRSTILTKDWTTIPFTTSNAMALP